MTISDLARRLPPTLPAPPAWVGLCVLGFAYWLAFLLVLEPGNVFQSIRQGAPLGLGSEALRMAIAASMGASVTPLLVVLSRRFPIGGARSGRHVAILLAAVTGLSLGLIVLSCYPAAWLEEGRLLPRSRQIMAELANNWLLLIYCMAAFIALAHAAKLRTARTAADPARIVVKARGRVSLVDVAEIDWVEAQGNYVALHVGAASHLVREPLGRFAAELDPDRFIRIHRRVIVALDRAAGLKPISNGDAMLTLADGRQLRVSRGYRRAVAERIGARA